MLIIMVILTTLKLTVMAIILKMTIMITTKKG